MSSVKIAIDANKLQTLRTILGTNAKDYKPTQAQIETYYQTLSNWGYDYPKLALGVVKGAQKCQ